MYVIILLWYSVVYLPSHTKAAYIVAITYIARSWLSPLLKDHKEQLKLYVTPRMGYTYSVATYCIRSLLLSRKVIFAISLKFRDTFMEEKFMT